MTECIIVFHDFLINKLVLYCQSDSSINSEGPMESMSAHENYYTILGCDENSTTEQIKKQFQDLARRHHPDKCTGGSPDDKHFLIINEAWNTLKDSELRKQYDAKLKNKELESNLFYATLTLDDLNVDETSILYSYPCRCGGTYLMTGDDISNSQCIINCDDCSFSILVKK